MDRKTKSFVKGIIWEVGVFFLITAFAVWFLGISIGESIVFNIIVTILKIIGLTIYDYMWEK